MRPLLMLLLLTGITACERVMIPPSAKAEYGTSFREMWTAIDEGYAHLEGNPVVWDSVYSRLSRSVDDLMTRETFFQVCRRMIDTLEDPEILLETGFSQYHYSALPSGQRNFDEYLLETHYWKDMVKTGPLYHTIMDSIGYIYYPSFEQVPTEAELDEVVRRLEKEGGTRGTIMDIRSNQQGSPENIFSLVARIRVSDSLRDKSSFLFSTAYKSGPKHDEFTAYKDRWVEMDAHPFFGRFIVLTNRQTRGAAHFFAAAAQAITTVTLVGDTTGGGGSFIASRELPNGWRIHFPASRSRKANGSSMQAGVVPQVRVDLSDADRLAGKDGILEAALAELKK